MYKRWKKLREELNIQKEDIKVIRKRVMGETHLKQINVEDEERNRIDITYCLHNKTYEVLLDYVSIPNLLTSHVISWDDEPFFYELKEN